MKKTPSLTIKVPTVVDYTDELDNVAATDDEAFGPSASELEFFSKLEYFLRNIYTITNPEKLRQGIVEKAIERYRGYEDVLARRLKKKYLGVADKECDELIDFVNKAHENDVVSRRTSQVWALKARKWFEEHGDKDDFEFQLLQPIDTVHRGSIVMQAKPASKMKKVPSVKDDLVLPSEPVDIHTAESPIVPVTVRKDSEVTGSLLPSKASDLEKVMKLDSPEEALPKITIEKEEDDGEPIPPAEFPHLDKLRNLLHDVYAVVNPDKLEQGVVEYAMKRYAGYEDVLAQRLLKKYVFEREAREF